jgi:hypothetical protein
MKLQRKILSTRKKRKDAAKNAPVTEQPDVVTETKILSSDSTNTLAIASRAEVEVGSADGPGLSTPAEADSGSGAARVRIVALARVIHLRARDLGVEGLDGAGGAINDGSAGIDDGLKVGNSCGRTNDCLGTGSLPETGRLINVMELDRARVLGSVGTTEEKV